MVVETRHCTEEAPRDVLLQDALQVFIGGRPQCPVEQLCQGLGVDRFRFRQEMARQALD